MRLIDADELMEHAWRDKLDSRELIAGMIAKAPTIKEIPTKIPIGIFEKLVSQEPFINKPCVAHQVCHEDKVKVLEKIRTEIEQAADKQFQIAMGVADLNERYAHIQMENAYRHSLSIIDEYKAESEE